MRKMREENAAMHQESSAAHNKALSIEGQKQVAIHDAEQQLRSDRARLQQVEATAERAYASTEHKLTIANREIESDRELLASTRQQEAHVQHRVVLVEAHGDEHVALLSGALRSTEEGQAGSLTQTQRMLEGVFQQREAQLKEQLEAEWASCDAQLNTRAEPKS